MRARVRAQAAARGRTARAQAAYHAGVAGLAHMQRRDPLEVRERGAEDSDLDRRRRDLLAKPASAAMRSYGQRWWCHGTAVRHAAAQCSTSRPTDGACRVSRALHDSTRANVADATRH